MINDALEELEDEYELEQSYIKESVKLEKEKSEAYWLKMTDGTPYYYAAVILHPNLQLAWFRKHRRQDGTTWISLVEEGLRNL